MIKLPRLNTNWDKQPGLLNRFWNEAMTTIEQNVNQLLVLPIIEQAIADAQDAAATAQAAAALANASAADANSAADAANDTAVAASRASALANSGTTGLTMSASDAGTSATVTISSHTRVYADNTSVSVSGGTVTGLDYSTTYYIYYDQPSRSGGSVTYQSTTSVASATQTGDRHLLGQIVTPAAAGDATDGDVVEPPGVGNIRYKVYD